MAIFICFSLSASSLTCYFDEDIASMSRNDAWKQKVKIYNRERGKTDVKDLWGKAKNNFLCPSCTHTKCAGWKFTRLLHKKQQLCSQMEANRAPKIATKKTAAENRAGKLLPFSKGFLMQASPFSFSIHVFCERFAHTKQGLRWRQWCSAASKRKSFGSVKWEREERNNLWSNNLGYFLHSITSWLSAA